jgi:hypothetical protein
MPVIGEPAIAEVKNSSSSGKLGGRKERPGPPDLSREIYDGFGPATDFVVAGNDGHLAQQLFGRQCEKGGDTGILQCGEAEAAFFKRVAETPRQRGANSAVAVEEDPASRGAPAFCVSHFCTERNHDPSKKGGFPPFLHSGGLHASLEAFSVKVEPAPALPMQEFANPAAQLQHSFHRARREAAEFLK